MSISVAFENHVFRDHAVSINTQNFGTTQLGTWSTELHRQLCKSCFAEHSFHWILKLFTVCFLSELLFCFSLSSSASLRGPPMWLMTITNKFSNNNAQNSQTIGLCIVLLQWCHNDHLWNNLPYTHYVCFTGNQTNISPCDGNGALQEP